MGARTYEKGQQILDAIDDASAAGKPEVASGLRLVFNDQSVDAAALLLKKSEPEREAILTKLAAGTARTVKEASRALLQDEREARRAQGEVLAAEPADARLTLHCCAVADLLQHVAADSVDVIICDPPYAREYLQTYSDLALFAAHALKPGGSLLVMTGQIYLTEVMESLGEHLRRHWVLAYLMPGGQSAQVYPRRVNPFWKPVLWYVKGEYAGDWHGDVVKSDVNDNDKRHHDWGQSESGFAALVEGWSKPGELVCDPFLGGGTTAVVALKLGRRVLGADVDAAALETTRARVAEGPGYANGGPAANRQTMPVPPGRAYSLSIPGAEPVT